MKQLEDLVSRDWYDDKTLLVPSDTRTYGCSFHSPSQYDSNPTQLWLGKPSTSVLLRGASSFVRLPDTFVALPLAYALDQYGVNPGLLLALMAR
jgi:hypothetical protein